MVKIQFNIAGIPTESEHCVYIKQNGWVVAKDDVEADNHYPPQIIKKIRGDNVEYERSRGHDYGPDNNA